MGKARNFNLRLFVGMYFGALMMTVAASIGFAFVYGDKPWAAMAVSCGFLVIFGLSGIALTFMLGRGMIKPVKTVASYVGHILDGVYDRKEEEALVGSMPGLGELVAELSSRFKERLGFSTSILEGLPVPICIVDTDQNITFLNRECLQMIGSNENPESYYGRKISQIFYKDDRKSKIADCMDDDTRYMNLEAIFIHEDGSDINVLANLFPLHDVEGKIIGGCCLYLNTTELKRREAEIVCQNERIATAANQATSVSEELAAAATQLEGLVSNAQQGTHVQTERSSETATAMEEMNATVLEVARHAQDAAINADEARTRAADGEGIVTEVVDAIHQVATHADQLKGSMEELDERSEAIGKVLSVIEDIADQTNLLALNAAIEAARAGEAGRGFAVVADEVRKLAEKTMQATNEVHSAITGIQDGARKNVQATEIAVDSVNKSTEMAGRSGEALAAIVTVAEATADQVRAIATAAEQQSAASEEINEATMEVTRVAGETESLMVEASEAIRRLSQLAGDLTKIIREMQ
ncbi:methyl-accepting chemotaxis protein [Pseudodesulfovibrio sp. zrk46]|uniref:methyl-accepting chemotaxis protein n=1 Tax=Pseudodesulfovibrio sp. zrk46 TaxID=2725288 RepID=UPI00144956A0|nr:methyl-accepting chemotaxis protein [Pseudodesulfovibrio sp. zrk46]QJB55041.1 PAS domain-containing protein [Pseudodesulfovibrio sp. zrk46]